MKNRKIRHWTAEDLEKFIGVGEHRREYPEIDLRVGQDVFICPRNVPVVIATQELRADSLPWKILAIPLTRSGFRGILVRDPHGLADVVDVEEVHDWESAKRMAELARQSEKIGGGGGYGAGYGAFIPMMGTRGDGGGGGGGSGWTTALAAIGMGGGSSNMVDLRYKGNIMRIQGPERIEERYYVEETPRGDRHLRSIVFDRGAAKLSSYMGREVALIRHPDTNYADLQYRGKTMKMSYEGGLLENLPAVARNFCAEVDQELDQPPIEEKQQEVLDDTESRRPTKRRSSGAGRKTNSTSRRLHAVVQDPYNPGGGV